MLQDKIARELATVGTHLGYVNIVEWYDDAVWPGLGLVALMGGRSQCDNQNRVRGTFITSPFHGDTAAFSEQKTVTFSWTLLVKAEQRINTVLSVSRAKEAINNFFFLPSKPNSVDEFLLRNIKNKSFIFFPCDRMTQNSLYSFNWIFSFLIKKILAKWSQRHSFNYSYPEINII